MLGGPGPCPRGACMDGASSWPENGAGLVPVGWQPHGLAPWEARGIGWPVLRTHYVERPLPQHRQAPHAGGAGGNSGAAHGPGCAASGAAGGAAGLEARRQLGDTAAQGQGGGRWQEVRAFPFHDAVYGCHFRTPGADDFFDPTLQELHSDVKPALENLMERARATAKGKEDRLHRQRQLARYEHELLKKLHLESFQDDFDEAGTPLVFQPPKTYRDAVSACSDLRPGGTQAHPGWMCVPLGEEYRGVAYWLS